MKKVAILLSSFNGEKYILDQINSIYHQQFNGYIHLFIRDDGSNDNTVKVIKQLDYFDSFITLIQGANIGGVKSFFELLHVAYQDQKQYDYFAFSDQDDVWDKDKIASAVDLLKKENDTIPILYGCSSRAVDQYLNLLSINIPNDKKITFFNTIIQNTIAGHTQVFNRKLAKIVMTGIEPENIYIHDSYVLNVAIICGKFIFDPNPHVSYRQHAGNQLGNTNGKGNIDWLIKRMHRINKGENKLYAKQIELIYKRFNCYMPADQKKELESFLQSRNNVLSRILYVLHTRFYRQRRFETLLFKLFYVIGGYNT